MPRKNTSSARRNVAGGSNGPAVAALTATSPGDWLSLALQHHGMIRTAFGRAASAPAGGSRLAAMKGPAIILNGHALAEEVVLYPVIAQQAAGGKPPKLYEEQSLAKVEMAALEQLDPADIAWAEKLAEIRAAVEEHMAEEETKWFPEIKASGANQAKLTARYKEEFERYTRSGVVGTNAAWDGPPRPVAV